jgi:Flp pilus assembly protein TadG
MCTRRLSDDERGAAVVEFTVLVPVLLFLMAGALEFGNALFGYHVINTGLRDAARYLARTNTPSSYIAQAKQLAVYGQIGGTTKRLSWWSTGDVTVTFRTIANPINASTGLPTYRGPNPIQVAHVAATVTYPGLGLFQMISLGKTLTISTYQEERVIGN